MKNLIAGGAGFIGYHLIRKLLENAETVICLDNFSTGNIDNIKKYNLCNNFTFIEHDIQIPLKIDYEVDRIWHLACPASPLHYQKDPINTIKTCFLGTYNLLRMAEANDAKLLLASTSEVYGDPLNHPQSESYNGNVNPIGIRSCYDEGKRISETLCFDFLRQYKVNISIARIFNTYGPHMSREDGRVVSNFIVQAILNKPITIFGNGSQTRSFCYVSDLVDGLIKLMNSSENGPINLGNDNEISINLLSNLIRDKVNPKVKFTYADLPKDDPTRRNPDLRMAKKILHWEPKIKLEEGLDQTIKYFLDELKNY